MSKNTNFLYCTVSVVLKMLPAPLIGVGEYNLSAFALATG